MTQNRESFSYESFVTLLEKVKNIKHQLDEMIIDVDDLKKLEDVDKEKIERIIITLKEVEITNKYIKEYLDRTVKWMITIAGIAFTLAISLLAASINKIINYLSQTK